MKIIKCKRQDTKLNTDFETSGPWALNPATAVISGAGVKVFAGGVI